MFSFTCYKYYVLLPFRFGLINFFGEVSFIKTNMVRLCFCSKLKFFIQNIYEKKDKLKM